MTARVGERDPAVDAAIARFTMVVIGLLFLVFALVIYSVLRFLFENSITAGDPAVDVWKFGIYAITTVASLPLIVGFKRAFMADPKLTGKQELWKQFSIYRVPKAEILSQGKIALLLFALFFVPLDFLTYLIPGMLEFQLNSIYVPPTGSNSGTGLYLTLQSFGLFFAYSCTIHFLVAFREETTYRGVVQFWGQEKSPPNSALVISAIFFGLSHFAYWFRDMTQPLFFPLWWGASGVLVGLVLGFYLKTQGRVWPLILAHWGNNLASTITLWQFYATGDVGGTMLTMFLSMYLPIILIGVVSAFLWRRTVRQAITIVKKEITTYIHQPRYEIFLDLLFGILLWLVLLLISG